MRTPVYLSRLGVHTDNVARIEYYHSTLAQVGHRRDTRPLLYTEFNKIQGIFPRLTGLGIITIEISVIGFHPYILTSVDIDVLRISGNIVILHPPGNIIIKNLGVGIEDTVVHSLLNPNHSVGSLEEVVVEVEL